MRIDFAWSENIDPETLVAAVERLGSELSLEVQTGKLKKYPGSIHWHLRRSGETGTIELTLWPSKRQFWLELRSNRAGKWTEAAVEAIRLRLEA